MLYASTGSMRCFECDDVGHNHIACSHKAANQHTYGGGAAASTVTEAAFLSQSTQLLVSRVLL